jgi:hypothetical protein
VEPNVKSLPHTWSRIVNGLNQALKTPTEDIPNTRWLPEATLVRLLVRVRDDVGAPKSLTGKSLLKSLMECGLARELRVPSEGKDSKGFGVYCLEMGGNPEISSLELLVATQPTFRKTAICYFTALQYHELTTQMIPHHHIAVLKTYPPATVVAEPSERIPPLGTLLFRWNGIPYYLTQRDGALVAGVQTVWLAEHALARITTLEQTLLDTLHRPWACGGPSVVFEAWGRGASVMDEARMAQHLRVIGNEALPRRVGYLLEQQGHVASNPDLLQLLRDAKDRVAAGRPDLVPLLPGVLATQTVADWGLRA